MDSSPISFFNELFQDSLDSHFIESRVIQGAAVKQSWFKDLGEFLAASLDQPEGSGMYYGIHPRDSKNGSGQAISFVTCLHADLDFKGFKGGPDEVQARLKSFQFPATVVVSSGNGLHAYWFLKEPEELEDKDLFERIQAGLQRHLGADKTHDLARILRIPGTKNYKNGDVKDCEIIFSDYSRRYTVEDFAVFEIEPEAARQSEPLPDEIPDSERNNNLYALGCSMRNFNADEPAILAALRDINSRRCKPPLQDSEVKQIARNVCTQHERKRAQKKEPQPLTLLTVGELLRQPEEERDWTAEGLLLAGGSSLLCSKPKVGKSTLARGLCVSVAQARPWLGRMAERGKVIYFALEEKPAEVRRHFKDLGATAADDILINFGPVGPNACQELARLAQELKPALIVVDTLFRFFRVSDVNAYAEVTKALDPLLEISRASGAHVMAVHHLRKDGQDVLGSTAIFGTVDTALLLKKSDDGIRSISTEQRYGDNLEDTVLELDIFTSEVKAIGSRTDFERKTTEEKILEFLTEQSEPVTEREIREGVEARVTLQPPALRSLLKAEKVVRSGKGRKGNPYRYSVSGSLYQVISREPEIKQDLNDCNQSTYSGSQEGKCREPEKKRWFPDFDTGVGTRNQKPEGYQGPGNYIVTTDGDEIILKEKVDPT